MVIGQLSEEDSQLFKKWLKSHLAFGPVTVTFTKKDGTERVMECTTSTALVPQEPVVEGAEPKREKKINEEVCPVYDLEANHWKSFRWDSIKSVSFKIGEDNELDNEAQ
jgi:hypothetical protein